MKLFVWDEFLPDWSDGLAFAIAENIEQAKDLIKAKLGCGLEFDLEWGSVQEFPITEAIAFYRGGGG